MTGIEQTVTPEQGGTTLQELPPLKALTPARLQSVLETMDRYESALQRLSEI